VRISKPYRSGVSIFSESQNTATIVAGRDDQDDSGDFGVALRNSSRHRMTIADTAESFIPLTLLIGGT